ncbi:dihydrofolate reductase [Glaciihabitans arcticus]|uniref:Dihydrofolate reductase n=1 Tax=Glaciihabitans arcticus TaxID=2668039 RepID=A0A4Q9GV93_9MICO|nr:dihydrofolate reductase family protein [Glaciihabitans arcticus]TBN57488.1 dihydrofolate reductase [Glaciihabitans arcticus]
MRKLVYYVATSIDGYIASPAGDFSAFPMEGDHFATIFGEFADALPAPAIAGLGLSPTGERFDTVLMGWNTYAVGLPDLPDPYPHLRQYVFSRSHGPADVAPGITLAADPRALVRELKAEEGGSDIWLCGGAQLAADLVDEIDTLILKVNPVLFGNGIPLLDGVYQPADFALVSSRSFESGVLITTYERV